MIRPGLAEKSPLWRLGSFLAGAAILLCVPLGRGTSLLGQALLAALVGFLCTAPSALHRLRGGEPWRPPLERVRVRELSPSTYIAYLLLYRVPVAIGDGIFTWLWNLLGRGLARDTGPGGSPVARPPGR